MELQQGSMWLRLALHEADKLIAISHWTANQLLQLDQTIAHKIVVVNPGIRLDTWTREPPPLSIGRFRESRGKPTLLTLARLTTDRDKGHREVLTTLAQPTLRNGPWRYWIVGDGPDRARLEALAHSLGITSKVLFWGALSDDELRAAFATADLFVMPSNPLRPDGRPAGEGFGLVYLEAAAWGVPSIGAAGTGAEDAIEHGVTGWLIRPGSGDLLPLLARLTNDANLLTNAGKAARERLRSQFGIDQSVDRLLEALGVSKTSANL
jgi:phosphatidylinositol alpha-1,6-mannosyltransferase